MTNHVNEHANNDAIRLPRGGLQPITGWPLKQFGMIEQARAGFLWRAMHTRPQWRQAAFAVLASDILDDPRGFLFRATGECDEQQNWSGRLSRFGQAILEMRPRDIIETAFGDCPDGVLGALDKIGFEALRAEAYPRLHAIFASDDPALRSRRRCLEQLSLLHEGHLDSIETLDPAALTPTIVNRHASRERAARLNEEIGLIKLLCSSATDDALRSSLEGDHYDRYPGWTGRWLQKVDMPLPRALPTDPLPFLERITPATAKAIGQEFENCLGRDSEGLSGMMMSGVFAMLAWREEGLLIELTLLDDGSWMSRRIHARCNAPVTDDMRLKVRSALEPVGVAVPIAAAHPPQLAPLLRELGVWRTPIDFLDIG
jgi:hypothetical protein